MHRCLPLILLAGCDALLPLHSPLASADAGVLLDTVQDRSPGESTPDSAPLDRGLDGLAPDGAVVDGRLADGPVADGAGDAGVVPVVWVPVPQGTFTMGSPASDACRYSDQETRHQVTLTHDLVMQATEVTQGQFAAVMGYNPSYFGPAGSGSSCGASCPVESVTWHEATAYCNTLSEASGLATCYSCVGSGSAVTCQEAQAYTGQAVYTCPGYRLPTDAEWEFAYRAGTQTAYYNGGHDQSKCTGCTNLDVTLAGIAWYCTNAGNGPHPVGTKQPNALGLHDMAGNVREWCHDWFQVNLGTSPVTDPWGAASGSSRLVRNGGWNAIAREMRAGHRTTSLPGTPMNFTGFRCCRTTSF